MSSPLPPLDGRYLVETLSRLATIPTEVPLGEETYMEPDHPKLVHYVQEVLRPEINRIGIYDIIDAPRNNLIVRLGNGSLDQSILIMNYTPVQHHNLMENPFSGKISSAREYGIDEPSVFGQGVSQSKAHQAVMLTVLKALHENGTPIAGRLYWAVNNEGRSSHDCAYAILDAIGDPQPDFGIIQLSTGMRLSLGNRGRIDVLVHVKGQAAHSSSPHLAHSAIEGAYEVMSRIRTLAWHDEHPRVGGRHALVYKIRYWPVAPHTLPSDAYLSVDRRLIPGDDPAAAVQEISDVIGDLAPFEVSVSSGPVMLPSIVEEDEKWVSSLQAAAIEVAGEPFPTFYGQGTFDAGGPGSRGIPTVMFGAGGGVWPLGIDFVPISAVEREAAILAKLITDELGPQT